MPDEGPSVPVVAETAVEAPSLLSGFAVSTLSVFFEIATVPVVAPLDVPSFPDVCLFLLPLLFLHFSPGDPDPDPDPDPDADPDPFFPDPSLRIFTLSGNGDLAFGGACFSLLLVALSTTITSR